MSSSADLQLLYSRVVVGDQKTVELRSTDSRGRLSPHEHSHSFACISIDIAISDSYYKLCKSAWQMLRTNCRN